MHKARSADEDEDAFDNNVFALDSAASFQDLPESLALLERIRKVGDTAVFEFFTLCFVQRFNIILFSYHKWADLRFVNILMPRALRQMILTIDMFGELLIAALWMDASGMAVADTTTIDWRDVSGCPENDPWTTLLVGAVLAFVAKVAVMLPILILQGFRRRRFVDVDSWSDRRRKRHLVFWFMKDLFIWIVCIASCLFSAMVFVSFWANVSWDIQRDWAVSGLIFLLQWYVFEPIERAFVLAFLSGLVAWRSPQLTQEACCAFLGKDPNSVGPERTNEEMPSGSPKPVPETAVAAIGAKSEPTFATTDRAEPAATCVSKSESPPWAYRPETSTSL